MAVADLAATGAEPAGLPDRERREVVVQHEALLAVDVGLERVQDAQLVVGGAERGHRQRLRFPPREQRRAVRPRQHVDFAGDVADVVRRSAVGAHAMIQDRRAHHVGFDLFEKRLDLFRVRIGDSVTEVLESVLLDLADRRVTRLLALDEAGIRHFRADPRADLRLRLRDLRSGQRQLGTAAHLGQPDLCVAYLDDYRMRPFDAGDHRLLVGFRGPAFDHRDAVSGARDHDVELTGLDLVMSRVDHDGAVENRYSDPGDRSLKGHVGDGHGRGCRHDRQHVRGVDLVRRDHGGNHLDVTAERLVKQRPQGTIDQAAYQDLTIPGPAFAPEYRPRDLPRGVCLFVVLHLQGDVVEPLDLLGGAADGRQDGGACILCVDRAVGLLGQATGLQSQRFFPDSQFYGMCHVTSLRRGSPATRAATFSGSASRAGSGKSLRLCG